MKKFCGILLALIASLSLFSCKQTEENKGPNNPDVVDPEHKNDFGYSVYLKAKESGYTGTYEEWLELIKGKPGKDGREIELQITDNNLTWRYKGESEWKTICPLSELVGPQGKPGENGHDGLSAFEIYKKLHPEYEGDEKQWMEDLVNGKLANKVALDYEIYPTPREAYQDKGYYSFKNKFNLIFGESIDEYTKVRAKDVFGEKGTTIVSDGAIDNATNVYVLVNGDDDLNTKEVKGLYKDDLAHANFNRTDSHMIKSDNNTIAVIGRDSNAAFYGVTTLKHILGQINRTIKNFTIYDFADTHIRGFIEGYYGNPWSYEDRMSLMRLGGEFKMTSYIFAPKNDPYHKEKWREPYPAEELAKMAQLAKVGNETKTRFVWTAHPFMGGFDAEDKDNEINKLIAKFDQLYTAGVRQFGVLGDDVGQLDRQIVIDMLTKVSEWANKKSADNPLDPVYDTVFCPAGYNHSWQNRQSAYQELDDLDANLPEDVQIFWTGEAVCKPVEQITLEHFRTFNREEGEAKRRSPLFWLNWPVNDVNHTRMEMGRGEQLHTDVNPDDLAGVVTNPMQEAEASKVAIFAVADYSWNVKGFNMDKSWADSFKYIDEDAARELHILAQHMTDPAPNGHGMTFDESWDLVPLIEDYKKAIKDNDAKATKEARAALDVEFNVITKAIEDFHRLSKNENLKDELLPYTNSLRDKILTIQSYMETREFLDNKDKVSAVGSFLAGNTTLATSKDYAKVVLGEPVYVEPAGRVIVPFMNYLQELLAEPMSKAIGAKQEFHITVNAVFALGLNAYNGKVESMHDGNTENHYWNGVLSSTGDYVELLFSEPKTIYGINIMAGTVSGGADVFKNAVVIVYTVANPEGEIVGTYEDYTKDMVINKTFNNVTAVRYLATGEPETGRRWFAMREFAVNLYPEEGVYPEQAFTNVKDLTLGSISYENSSKMQPKNDLTLKANEYVGLDLHRIQGIKALNIAKSSDDANLKILISPNGSYWVPYEKFNDNEIPVRYVILKNVGAKAITFNITNFSVEYFRYDPIKLVENTFGDGEIYQGSVESLFDHDRTSGMHLAGAQTKDAYFIIDLGREINLESFKVVVHDGEVDFARHGKFEVSLDNKTYTQILTLGNQDGPNPGEDTNTETVDYVFPDHEISYNTKSVSGLNKTIRYIKYTCTIARESKWIRFADLELNGNYAFHEFDARISGDVEPTIESDYKNAIDGDITTSFIPNQNAGTINYYTDYTNVKTIKIVQTSQADAKAKVYILAVNPNDLENPQPIELGVLTGALNEFTVPEGKLVYGIMIEFEKLLQVYEIVLD